MVRDTAVLLLLVVFVVLECIQAVVLFVRANRASRDLQAFIKQEIAHALRDALDLQRRKN